MKQIIGYMEYDYMNIKSGMWYMLLVFGIASTMFSVQSAMGAIGYMLFGGLILASTAFNVTRQTVSFTALVPGSILQKVLGRYLGGIASIAVCVALGSLSATVVRAAGYENGTIDPSLLSGIVGVTLLFLTLQNVMLYLLTPLMGVQFITLIRMLPGFILFFLFMSAGKMDFLSGTLQQGSLPGALMLAAGIAGLFIGVFLSCLILRNRDDE